jgi:2-keto-4-pentenoate hydratase/2-oxohepta-3-ene-1,7-dioic acid hydratase in catechol pathway
MLYARFKYNGKTSYGIVEGDSVTPIAGNLFGKHKKAGRKIKLSKVQLLAPCKPGKLIAIGLNYKSHIGDRPAPSKPEMFLKTPTSIQDPDGDIIFPKVSSGNRIEPEGELVIVIGKKGKHIPTDQAQDYIFGYTCGNDVSEREWQGGDLQWARAKSSDTFSPFGPYIQTEFDFMAAWLYTRVNGVEKQKQTTGDLIFNPYEIVAQCSQTMTLEPGDVIFTGTPGRPQAMKPGDVVEVEISGIGILRNTVKAEA